MKTMLIVYHSMTGGTKQMADAAAAGARTEAEAYGHLLKAADTGRRTSSPPMDISSRRRRIWLRCPAS